MMSDHAASSSADRVELIVSRSGHPDRRLMLKAGVISLGRAEENDLVLPDIGVSRRHARIIVDHAGVTVEDLGSGNGTLFEGRPVRKKQIADGDVLQIDPFQLRFQLRLPAVASAGGGGRAPMARLDAPAGAASAASAGPPRLVLTSDTELDRDVYPILPAGLTLGRSTDQDVVLGDPAASRRHVVIAPRQGGVWLEDVGSANGTFVNDERVYQQHMLRNGDEVRIGQTTFRFEVGGGGVSDPLSGMWVDSGVWQRPIREDDAQPEPRFSPRPPPEPVVAPAPAPPPRPRTASSSAPTVGRPARPEREGSGQGRLLWAVGVLLFLLVIGVVLLLTLGPRLLVAVGLWGQPDASAVVERLPPDTALPVLVMGEEAGQKLLLGQALLSSGRPLEAATLLYQALRAEPEATEVERIGYVACEAAAMHALRDALRRPALVEAFSAQAVQGLVREVDRAEDAELLALRVRLVDALLVWPGESRLVAALGKVDSRLAGLAGEKLKEAEASADGVVSWALLQEALQLAPTSTAVARATWSRLWMAQVSAVPLAQQALALDVAGQPAAALPLYARVIEVLPGDTELLERQALARVGVLAP